MAKVAQPSGNGAGALNPGPGLTLAWGSQGDHGDAGFPGNLLRAWAAGVLPQHTLLVVTVWHLHGPFWVLWVDKPGAARSGLGPCPDCPVWQVRQAGVLM